MPYGQPVNEYPHHIGAYRWLFTLNMHGASVCVCVCVCVYTIHKLASSSKLTAELSTMTL